MKHLFVSLFTAILFMGMSSIVMAVDTPESLEGAEVVSAEKVKELMAKGVPLFDVRLANEYADGHIKGAQSLPYVDNSKAIKNFDASVDKFEVHRLPASNIILQCNGSDCWKSYKASAQSVKAKKKGVYWFRGGIPEWKAKGLPIEK